MIQSIEICLPGEGGRAEVLILGGPELVRRVLARLGMIIAEERAAGQQAAEPPETGCCGG